MKHVNYNYQPITKDDIKILDKNWKRYCRRRNKMMSFGNFIKFLYLVLLIIFVNVLGIAVMVGPAVLGITLATFVNPFMMWLMVLLIISIPLGLSICFYGTNACMNVIDEVING